MPEAIHAGQEPEVVDTSFDEAEVGRHPDEESHRQNEECKRGETVAELGGPGNQDNTTTVADTTVRKTVAKLKTAR